MSDSTDRRLSRTIPTAAAGSGGCGPSCGGPHLDGSQELGGASAGRERRILKDEGRPVAFRRELVPPTGDEPNRFRRSAGSILLPLDPDERSARSPRGVRESVEPRDCQPVRPDEPPQTAWVLAEGL